MISDVVKVALITAIPPTIGSVVWGWVNHSKLSTIEVNTNHRLDMLLNQRNDAVSRADIADGVAQGIAQEKASKEEKK